MNTLLILTLSLVTSEALASSLTSGDRQRFVNLFQSAVQEEANVDFGVLGLKLLGENVVNAGELCKKLQSQADVSSVNAEKLSSLTSDAKSLPSCVIKLNSNANKVIKSLFGNFLIFLSLRFYLKSILENL